MQKRPSGRGRWLTDNLDTGDSGHSATGTSIRVEARPIGLRLAILFGLSAIIGDAALLYFLTFIRGTPLTLPTPKVLCFPTDLEAVSP